MYSHLSLRFLPDWFETWKHREPGSDPEYLITDFASPYGAGASIGSCVITSLCPVPDCLRLENYNTRAGTGSAYMIIVSFYNVMRVSIPEEDSVCWDQSNDCLLVSDS